jgi:hypothetical protein
MHGSTSKAYLKCKIKIVGNETSQKKMAVFWVVAPCTEDGGSKDL